MTRYGRGTTGGSGGGRTAAPAGPMRMDERPRPGIQMVEARKPRVGPSAAEVELGAVPPIDLAEGLTNPPLVHGDGMSLKPGAVNYLPGTEPPESTDPVCCFCGNVEANDLLVHFAGSRWVCSTCVERLVDAVREELPRRRLRLAMEKLAAGPVTMETVAAVEQLARASAHPAPASGGGND